MRRLVFVLLVLVVAIVGVGFYRSWFTANPEKIQEDEKRAKREVQELVQEVKAKTGNRTTKAKEGQ
jgi:flagellar basal body-associated protein FliL